VRFVTLAAGYVASMAVFAVVYTIGDAILRDAFYSGLGGFIVLVTLLGSIIGLPVVALFIIGGEVSQTSSWIAHAVTGGILGLSGAYLVTGTPHSSVYVYYLGAGTLGGTLGGLAYWMVVWIAFPPDLWPDDGE
jgi:hypothetical protein